MKNSLADEPERTVANDIVAFFMRWRSRASRLRGGCVLPPVRNLLSYCDVYKLKNTQVTPPEDLEAVTADTYFNSNSSYAVTGGRFAGGYFGNADIGSAASVGGLIFYNGNSVSNTASTWE